MTDLEYENLEIVSHASRFIKWTADLIEPFVGGKVLEIGAGYGGLYRELEPGCVSYEPTDIDLQFSECKRLDITKKALDKKFDTIIASNVFEHLAFTDQAWENVCEMLERKGQFILIVPYGKKLYGSLDEAVGHYLRYEDWIVYAEMPEKCQLIDRIPFNRVSSIAWWVNGKILRKKKFSLFQIKILELFIPFIRLVDKYLPLPPLSVIYVIEKNA